MKHFIYTILCLMFLAISCQTQNNIALDYHKLNIESATQRIGDVWVNCVKYSNQENQLVKLYASYSSSYKDVEYLFYYAPDGNLISSDKKSFQRLCGKGGTTCFTDVKNTYRDGTLKKSSLRTLEYTPQDRPNLDTLAYEENPQSIQMIQDEDMVQLKKIQLEIGQMNFKKASFYEGRYKYFADSGILECCNTGKIYAVSSYFLEKAYQALGVQSEFVYASFIAKVPPTTAKEEGRLQRLEVQEVIEVDKDKSCPNN